MHVRLIGYYTMSFTNLESERFAQSLYNSSNFVQIRWSMSVNNSFNVLSQI